MGGKGGGGEVGGRSGRARIRKDFLYIFFFCSWIEREKHKLSVKTHLILFINKIKQAKLQNFSLYLTLGHRVHWTVDFFQSKLAKRKKSSKHDYNYEFANTFCNRFITILFQNLCHYRIHKKQRVC